MRILIISFSDLRNDPRVNRQIRHLRLQHEIVAAGLRASGLEREFVPLPAKSFSFRLRRSAAMLCRAHAVAEAMELRRLSSAISAMEGFPADVIVANDVESLPIAFSLRKPTRIIFDAHEYSPRQFDNSLSWRMTWKRFNAYLLRKYLHRVAEFTTVCEGIADEYASVFGRKPEVITNALRYHEGDSVRPPGGIIRVLHHGAVDRSRRVENMIRVCDYLDDRFSFDFMLVRGGNVRYYNALRRMIAKRENARLIDPVPMESIVSKASQYDVGLYLLPQTTFNTAHALPNKFFEFIQARLVVAIGPSVEMARYVRQYGNGIVAEDFEPESVARALNALDRDQIWELKKASAAAARELNEEKNLRLLDALVLRAARYASP